MPSKKPADEAPKGAPMWVVTFTDMISLLLTFFIMLLTFSSMEDEKLRQATGSLSGAFGVMTPERQRSRTESQASHQVQYKDQHPEGATDPSMRKDQVDSNIDKIQDRELYNVKLDRRDSNEGSRITVLPTGREELFDLGFPERVGESANMALREIGAMFASLPVRLVIETHSDSLVPGSVGMTPLELTTVSGLAAAKVLIEAGMTPERVGVSPRGDFEPLAGNEEALDRFKNRRLEILVIPDWKDEAFQYTGG